MDLLAQHVGNPARTIGAGSADRYWLRHAVTLMQLRGIFRAADRGPQQRFGVLRRVRFS
jgi:hypothetical protein